MNRHAKVPKKYEHIDFTPPESVANAAAKGLELRQKASPSNRGGLTPAEASKEGIGSGVQRAVNLKNRDNVSPEVIKQMRGFLSRSQKSSEISAENKDTPWNDKGYVAWLLWGGDPAVKWVDKIIKQMEAADEKEKQASLIEKWGSLLINGDSSVYFHGTSEESARKAAGSVLVSRTAAETGDGSEHVGVFAPLPSEIAAQFPQKEEDTSRPHVTLCYIGPVPENNQGVLVDAIKEFYSQEVGPVMARLSGVDYFRTQTGCVAYSKVVFSKDIGSMKDRLKSFLEDRGIEINDNHPLAFNPHVTLEYMDDPHAIWDGHVPTGSWTFKEVEVWGLSEIHRAPIGDTKGRDKIRDIQKKRESLAHLRSSW